MALGLETYSIFGVIQPIAQLTACTFNVALFCYHIIRMLRFHKAKRHISWIERLSLFAMSAAILFNICSIIISLNIYPSSSISCKLSTNILSAQYMLFKFLLHFLFLQRLHRVFKDTMYSFKRSSMIISKLFLLLLLIISTFIIFITGNEESSNHKSDLCYGQFPWFTYIYFITSDLFIALLTSITFTRNLISMGLSTPNECRPRSKSLAIQSTASRIVITRSISVPNSIDVIPVRPSEKSTKPKTKERKLELPKNPLHGIKNDPTVWNAVNKFTLLSIVCMLSTSLMFICCAIFGIPLLWMSLDTMINAVSIVLIFTVHHRVYAVLCTGIQNVCISIACLSCYSCHYCWHIESKEEPTAIAKMTNESTDFGTYSTTNSPSGDDPSVASLEIKIDSVASKGNPGTPTPTPTPMPHLNIPKINVPKHMHMRKKSSMMLIENCDELFGEDLNEPITPSCTVAKEIKLKLPSISAYSIEQ